VKQLLLRLNTIDPSRTKRRWQHVTIKKYESISNMLQNIFYEYNNLEIEVADLPNW